MRHIRRKRIQFFASIWRNKVISLSHGKKVGSTLWVNLKKSLRHIEKIQFFESCKKVAHMKERFSSLRHFEKTNGFQFFESKWQKDFISLSHIEKRFIKRGSILWVILKNSIIWLFLKKKWVISEKKRFNSVSRIRIFKKNSVSHVQKGFNSASHLSNGFNSFRHIEKRVQFFESHDKTSIIWFIFSKKKIQFFESYFSENGLIFSSFSKKKHFVFFNKSSIF